MENSVKKERSSIEEAKKIIERKIKEAEHYSDITGLYLTLDEELRNALMNILSDYKKVLKENEKLKNIRYDTPYGTETIHLIPESNLIEINTQKYMIEVEPGKFVDLKQVYLENKKLNEYKENYISVEKIKTELTELKKEYVHIQEIKREKGDFGEEKSKIQTVLLYKIEALQDLLN